MLSAGDPVDRWLARLTPVSAGGLRTFVLEEGYGDPVVLLHGIPSQAYLWRDVARGLARDYRVIAPDLLGFGFADRAPSHDLSPRGQADFLELVLRELGVEDFALAVHDYGALVGAELLARDPSRIRALVICNTSFWPQDWHGAPWSPFRLLRVRPLGELAFRLARPFMLRRAMALYLHDERRLTRNVLRVYWHPFEHGFAGTLLRLARDDRFTRGDLRRWRHALHDWQGPASVAWGAHDPTFRVSRGRSIAKFTNATYHELPDSNHFVPEDAPEQLARIIVATIERRSDGH